MLQIGTTRSVRVTTGKVFATEDRHHKRGVGPMCTAAIVKRECPLWVISRHCQGTCERPLYPESGHHRKPSSCLLSATFGLMHRGKLTRLIDECEGAIPHPATVLSQVNDGMRLASASIINDLIRYRFEKRRNS